MLVAAVLAGCTYKAATSTRTTAEDKLAATEVGCLDVGVERRADRALVPVLEFAVTNHCDRAMQVDLGWASVIGRTAEGAELALVPVNASETAAQVGAGQSHEAMIAYSSATSIGQLCVDVSTLVDANAKTQWRCFGNVVSVTMR